MTGAKGVSPPRPSLVGEAGGHLAVALAKCRADEAVRQSEERYHNCLCPWTKASPSARCSTMRRQGGRLPYLEVNPAFARLTGLPVEQVVGRRVREVIPGIESYWIEAYDRVLRSGQASGTTTAWPS